MFAYCCLQYMGLIVCVGCALCTYRCVSLPGVHNLSSGSLLCSNSEGVVKLTRVLLSNTVVQ